MLAALLFLSTYMFFSLIRTYAKEIIAIPHRIGKRLPFIRRSKRPEK